MKMPHDWQVQAMEQWSSGVLEWVATGQCESSGVASGSRTHVELDAPSHGLSTSTSTSKSMFMTMSMSMEEGGKVGCLTKRAQ
ncbi:hypothetical protein ACLKA6_010917 [Drosophila palustris]